jgi:hypothetical protein
MEGYYEENRHFNLFVEIQVLLIKQKYLHGF